MGGHSRDHADAHTGDDRRRLAIAIALNVGIVALQVVAGLVAGSIGLLSDAGHNLTDVGALVLSWLALRMARRAPTAERSFGWHRGTVLAAQANSALLLVLTSLIVVESVRRLGDPPEVDGAIVLGVALVGFVVNGASAVVVGHDHGGDLNLRSATLHLVSDAAASLGVAVAGGVILLTGGWNWLDPAVSLLVAAAIGWQAVRLLRSANAVLLEGTPEGLDPAEVLTAMAEVEGVEAVHDLHAWSLSSRVLALSAHVVIDGHPTLEEAQEVAGRVRAHLAGTFGITHATLELECETCEDHGPACEIRPAGASASTAPA